MVTDTMMSAEARIARDKKQIKRLMKPPALDLARDLKSAVGGGKSGSRGVLKSILRARGGPGKLSAGEVFYYRLQNPAISQAERHRYAGLKAQDKFHAVCNNRQWYAPCNDKLLFYTIMQGAGLPVPDTVAVYQSAHRSAPAPVLRDGEALRAFLGEASNFPLFAKPIDGMYSVGAMALLGSADGRMTLKGDEALPVEDLAQYIEAISDEGYLFQRVMQPHPDLLQAFADAIATIRFLVLYGKNGVRIESALIKIPGAGAVADNYWRQGNLLGALDRSSGCIERAVTGLGAAYTEVENHPDSGQALGGFQLPDFAAAREHCLEAAAMFPGIRTQSWDIALTDQGPVMVEFNFGGDLNLHQLAHGRGALSPDYVAHLKQCGYRGKLPAAEA